MKKKILSLLLAAMMLMSMGACSERETEVPEVEPPVQEKPVEDEKPAEDEKPVEETPVEEEEVVEIDVPERGETLKEWTAKNSDIKGWLYIPDTQINSPIVQTTNNEFYLRKDELKNYSWTGCYWADNESPVGETADDMWRSTVIYGHNVDYIDPVDEKEGDRFSQLFHFADIEWAKEHPYIYFSTTGEDMLWEIFAVSYTTDFSYINVLKDRNVSKTEQITEGQMINIVNSARDRSEYDYVDVEVDGDDKILTLSTCTYKFGKRNDIRFIVMAKLVTEEDKLVETANITANADKIEIK